MRPSVCQTRNPFAHVFCAAFRVRAGGEKDMTNENAIGYCVMPEEMFLGSKYPKDKIFADAVVYEGLVSPLSKKANAGQFHIGVFEEGSVLTFEQLNSSMKKEETILNYLEMLCNSLEKIITENVEFPAGAPNISIRFGELSEHDPESSARKTNMRLLIMMKDFSPLTKEQEQNLRKKLLGELNNWVEEVIHDKPYEAPKEDYENDITFRMSADMIPHEQAEVGGADSMMAIFAIVFAVIGIFLREYYVFGVMAAVIGICFAIRSFQHERYIVMGLCMLSAVVGLCSVGWEYMTFKNTYSGIAAQVITYLSLK